MEPRFRNNDPNMPNNSWRRLAVSKSNSNFNPSQTLIVERKRKLATAAQYEATTRPTREALVSELKGALHT